MIDCDEEERTWAELCRVGAELRELTAEVKAEFAKADKVDVTYVYPTNFSVAWKKANLGKGEIKVHVDENGSISCDNEYLHRSIVRKILHSLADHIADNATFTKE